MMDTDVVVRIVSARRAHTWDAFHLLGHLWLCVCLNSDC